MCLDFIPSAVNANDMIASSYKSLIVILLSALQNAAKPAMLVISKTLMYKLPAQQLVKARPNNVLLL